MKFLLAISGWLILAVAVACPGRKKERCRTAVTGATPPKMRAGLLARHPAFGG